MKILFTADWHLYLRKKLVPKEWASNRFHMLFKEIYKLEREVDQHIIGGDIFEKEPNLQEFGLFIEFISKISIPTYIYTGNHEAISKKKSFLSDVKELVRNINSNVHIIDEITEFDTYTIVPYEYIKTKCWKDLDKSKAIFTHVRGEIPPHVKPEIDLEQLYEFPVIFAGDLHSHQNTQNNIVYPGSPCTITFHRELTEESNGYLIIDSDTLDWKWYSFNLPQLIRKTINNESEIKEDDYHLTVFEMEGEAEDLKNIKSDKVGKKVIKREKKEPSLKLEKDMTLIDELVAYLKNENYKDIDKIVEVFNDNIKETELE